MLSLEITTILSIAAVQLLAVMSPGPSFLVTARASVTRSRWTGVQVALGLGVGSVIWAAAALFGLNALFHAVPVLFFIMKCAGALFLLYLAWQIMRHAHEPLSMAGEGETGEKDMHPFLRGLLVQLGNPKVVVFFGSIFVTMLPANPPFWMLVTLLAVVAFNEIVWYSLVSLFFGAGKVRQFYLAAKSWIDRITGAFLGVLGLRLLWGAFKDA